MRWQFGRWAAPYLLCWANTRAAHADNSRFGSARQSRTHISDYDRWWKISWTFENYVASVISEWQTSGNAKLGALEDDLIRLGLTWRVSAERANDTEVEIKVGWLPQPREDDARHLVSIADVGIGVSQILPVLVALHAAGPENLVYLEQPEIHLHPKAQLALADVLVKALKRGVRIVVETHSALLLLRLQTLIAQGQADPKDINLIWFQRNRFGETQIEEGGFDNDGAFGEWPADFGSLILKAESDYLDAVEDRVQPSK